MQRQKRTTVGLFVGIAGQVLLTGSGLSEAWSCLDPRLFTHRVLGLTFLSFFLACIAAGPRVVAEAASTGDLWLVRPVGFAVHHGVQLTCVLTMAFF